MPPELAQRAVLILSALYLPLVLGYFTRKLKILGDEWTTPVMRWLVVLVEPPIIMYSLWALKTEELGDGGSAVLGVFAVTLSAALITSSMAFFGRVGSGFFNHEPPQRGAFIITSALSNNGFTFGIFVALLFLGFQAQVIAIIYTIYFFPYFVTVIFGIAEHYGGGEKKTAQHKLKNLIQPMTIGPLIGFSAGLLLHVFAKSKPPAWIMNFNSWAVPTEVAIYSFAIGCSLYLSSIRKYWRECIAMCGIKFLLMPAVAMGIVAVLQILRLFPSNPLMVKVVLIQSIMPSAIMAVVVSKLYKLDEHLSNSCWVVTTVVAMAVLPVLYMLVT